MANKTEREKEIRAKDARLLALEGQLKEIRRQLRTWDPIATDDKHEYRWEIAGVSQGIDGIQRKREELAKDLGRLLLGIA